MNKIKKAFISFIIFFICLCGIYVNAETSLTSSSRDTTLHLSNVPSASSNNTNNNNNATLNTNESKNTTGTSTSILERQSATTVSANSDNKSKSTLPKAGLSPSMGVIFVVVAGAAAIFYNKVVKYNLD